MKVNSRKFSGTIAFALIICLGFAGLAMAADSALTIGQAVELAKANSATLQIAKLTYENDEITWKKALAANPTRLAERSAGLAWEKAQFTYRTAESDLITATVDSYLNVQNAAFTLTIRNKQADQSRQALARVQILADKGSAGPTDILQAEMTVMQSENALDQAGDAYTAALNALQRLLGMETAPVLPTTLSLRMPEIKISLADAITAGLASSSAIIDLENGLELQRILREQDEATGLAPLDDAKSKNDLRKVELQLAEAKASRVDSITAQYTSLIQAQKTLALQEASYTLTQKQYEISRKQVDAGIKTAIDFMKDEIALLQADLNVRAAQRTYVNSWLSFQKALGNSIDLSEVVKSDANQ